MKPLGINGQENYDHLRDPNGKSPMGGSMPDMSGKISGKNGPAYKGSDQESMDNYFNNLIDFSSAGKWRR